MLSRASRSRAEQTRQVVTVKVRAIRFQNSAILNLTGCFRISAASTLHAPTLTYEANQTAEASFVNAADSGEHRTLIVRLPNVLISAGVDNSSRQTPLPEPYSVGSFDVRDEGSDDRPRFKLGLRSDGTYGPIYEDYDDFQ